MNEVPVRLLRETLQARVPAGPSQECLDAETVAAWADHALGRDERRAAEAHAADCVRCQALVAAMVKTAPPAATRSWWRTPVMGWLVPLTAAAAALLVWMIVPGTQPAPSGTMVSRAIEQEPSRPAQDAISNTRADTPNQEKPIQGKPIQDKSVPPSARPVTAKVNARAANATRDKAQVSAAETSRNEARAALADAFKSVGNAAPPAAPAVSPALPEAPATPASPAPQQAAAASASAAPPPVTVQRAAGAPVGPANARMLMLDPRRPTTLIVSSNLISQWRILANGTVQHSTDSGSTWAGQATGVTGMLTAGSSPAPSICWLVGPQGIVLLSTDGRSWRRLAFPETADLTAVRATDDKSATVNTADGRGFTTTDGGQTWMRSPAF
jgi:hypothetical protein